MGNRILPFIHDTADQQRKLEELGGNRKQLSDYGLAMFKLDVLFFGKIVLADSHLYNNFFFHEMSDEDYREFCTFVTECDVLEARFRPGLPVRGIFGKECNIRSYWNADLEAAVRSAGIELGKRLENDPHLLGSNKMSAYLDELKIIDPGIINVQDFNKFEHIMRRTDDLVFALGTRGNISLWDITLSEMDTFQSGSPTEEFQKNKTSLINIARRFSGDTSALIAYIEAGEFNGSKLENLCRDLGWEQTKDFFNEDLHRDCFCVGAAKQHFCHNYEVGCGAGKVEPNGISLQVQKDKIDNISRMKWREFADMCTKGDAKTHRDSAIALLSDPNVPRSEVGNALSKLCNALDLSGTDIDSTSFDYDAGLRGGKTQAFSFMYYLSQRKNDNGIYVTYEW